MATLAPTITPGHIDRSLKLTLLDAWVNVLDKEAIWKKCGFTEKNSRDFFEDVVEYSPLGPAPRKVIGEQMSADAIAQGFGKRINQIPYAVMMKVSEEALKFNRYGDAVLSAKRIGESLRLTQELITAGVFADAFDANAAVASGDGEALVSLTHKLVKGGTFANAPAVPASLNHLTLEAICQLARTMPGGNGYPMGVMPQILIIHTDLIEEAQRIMMSPLQNDTATFTYNTLKGKVRIQGNPFLASKTNWFVITDHDYGLCVIWTQKPKFRTYSEESHFTKVFDGYMMLAADCIDPRAIIGVDI